VGKTGMTQAIAAGIARAGPSHAPVSSFNNHIGVPLTLARMPRNTRRAVFELGMNHAGEIGPLSRLVRPNVAVITTVGAVHTENFPDGEAGVARAKAEIFQGVEPGSVAVLNAEIAWYRGLARRAEDAGAAVVACGMNERCEGQLVKLLRTDSGLFVQARIHGQGVEYGLRQKAAHAGLASLMAILTLEALDVPLGEAIAALSAFEPLSGRGEERRIAITGGAFTLVDESYNANPMSVGAALDSLGAHSATGRRVAVLTDMLELGDDAADRHAALAREIEAARIDLVFCAGPLMESLWNALPATRRGGWAAMAETLAPEVVAAIQPGDVVMVKGSKGSKASLIAEALSRTGRLSDPTEQSMAA
jgi:UDP-N-acetylmuramoyl-tripeptide--D-alanyl-D-alanine ligase